MTERPRSSLAVWLIVATMLLPVAYVLSAGPFVWLHNHGYLPDIAIWLYLPLLYAHQGFEPARNAIDWYVGLWGG